MKLSILDIAKKSGVSKSTVSRVINGGSVSEISRRKVLDTMQELGYYPNFMARGLRGVKNPVVGVLSSGGLMFLDPSLSTRFAGIVSTLQQHGYDLLLVHDGYGDENGIHLPKYASYLREHRIDGLITIGHSDLPEIKRAADTFRNVVYSGERIDPNKGFRIYQGNYEYSYDVYSLLLSRGHRRIFTITTSLADQERLILNRRLALQKACSQFGAMPEECGFFSPRGYTVESGIGLLEQVYQHFCRGCYTAIFIDSFYRAKALLGYFNHKGLLCPQDYSLISLEQGNEEASRREDFITGVWLPDYNFGVRAAELMVEVIENPHLVYKDVIMPYRIIERKSVREIPR